MTVVEASRTRSPEVAAILSRTQLTERTRLHSGYERVFASALREADRHYGFKYVLYEFHTLHPMSMADKRGRSYTPDFFIPNIKTIFEPHAPKLITIDYLEMLKAVERAFGVSVILVSTESVENIEKRLGVKTLDYVHGYMRVPNSVQASSSMLDHKFSRFSAHMPEFDVDDVIEEALAKEASIKANCKAAQADLERPINHHLAAMLTPLLRQYGIAIP